MSCGKNGEGPALLQLHRWDPSQIQLDFSEYREAFLSPTRELMLLLSYQSEALLLPLSRGDSYRITTETCTYESQESVNVLSSSACRPDSLENMPSTSESVRGVSNDGISMDSTMSRLNAFPYISDVSSLAWGMCGDTYKQHNEAPFKEFLIAVGNCGVTFHAFRQVDDIDAIGGQSFDNENKLGRWVEWGSFSGSPHDKEAPRDILLPIESRTNGDRGISYHTGQEPVCNFGALTSKKWLRSFLSSAKTMKSDGTIRTLFPEKSELPCSATVVSFFVDFRDPILADFYSGTHSVFDKGVHEEKQVHISVDNGYNAVDHTSLDGLVSDANVAANQTYTCFRVFSSWFHCLIGFVLSSGFDNSKSSCDSSGKSQDILVLVALLDIDGLQWLYTVKLPEKGISSEAEWVDFQISDKFLISLNKFGSIPVHGALTGEYIVHLDVSHIHGVKPEQNMADIKKLSIDVNDTAEDDTLQNKYNKAYSFAHKKSFRRLIVAPYSCLFAVVDECGVLYTICANDHMPDKYAMIDNILPQYEKLGILASWVVGHSNISQQKTVLTSSVSEKSFMRDKVGDLGSQHVQRIQGINRNDLTLSSFSAISQQTIQSGSDPRSSQCIRKLFIPSARNGVADIICYSPFGVTRFVRRNSNKHARNCIFHTNLYIESNFSDDNCLNCVNKTFGLQNEENFVDEEAVGCVFQGCLYLVTRSAVSIVLPSVSLSSNFHTMGSMSYQLTKTSEADALNLQNSLIHDNSKHLGLPWQVAIIDRILLYEGPDEADRLCLENGWKLRISRLRRLQLALAYLKFEEMDLALGSLAEVDIAEEGILLLIFAAIYMIVHRVGKDAEVSAALRILSLGARFAIKMLRKYAILELRNESVLQSTTVVDSFSLPPQSKEHSELTDSRTLYEMAYYLEIIRNIQRQVASNFKSFGKGLVDTLEAQHPEDLQNSLQDDYQLYTVADDVPSFEQRSHHEPASREGDAGYNDSDQLSLVPVKPIGPEDLLKSEMQEGESLPVTGGISRKKLIPMENPKEMFARWEMDNLDLRNVVKDALLSGRLPLAVLQLHLHRIKDIVDGEKPGDTFAEVRDIGRAIAYELLLKGETTFAVSTLQKLGEDIEGCLKQLLFGTVSRSLRSQIAEEVKKYGFLRSYELAIIDRISLIERIYPCSSFWKTYCSRREEGSEEVFMPTEASEDYQLRLLFPPTSGSLFIECGDIDGVVLASWANFNGIGSPEVDDDSSHAGYWAAAAVWSDAWDQTTIDRILLDQPYLLGVHVMWESQFEFHVCHNDWEEVFKLLSMIPSSLLVERSVLISLDSLQSTSSIRQSVESVDFPDYGSYACSPGELEAVCIDIPNVKLFSSPANEMCSSWLRVLIGKELAKKFIFLKEYWDDAGEIIFLLAQCGFLDGENAVPSQNGSLHHSAILDPANIGVLHPNALQAFHKLFVHYSAQNNLPYFLDLYLDHHKLALDNDVISALLEATGDCQWAKWLLFSRIKGHEYDASFFNARALVVRDVASDSRLPVLEANEIISTVDDIAEVGWLLAALATLMYAPLPIQSCLSSGSVKRSCSSFQCTLENLRPTLHKFPTLWRTLVSSFLGHDTTQSFCGLKGRNALSAYINWRDSVFYSSGHDTSLLQMLPFWFPKSLRRLIQLFVQGPLGWQSMAGLTAEEAYLQRDIDLMNVQEYSEISAMSWEVAIQKQIEQELYPSSIEETGLALEQHLHRGHALAAFNQLLGSRVQKLKSDGNDRGQSSSSLRGQANVQSDVQALLSPLTQNEESLLSSVIPLAITHYQNYVLVASCALLLEICGLSASVLRVDVAALRRIHDFYRSNQIVQQHQLLSNSATLRAASSEITIADSLAQALADYYLHQSGSANKKDAQKPVTDQQPSTLLLVLQHLEKASLLVYDGEKTCGSWLLSGDGDGNELRSKQKAASQRWNLVILFCQMHQIPLSTVYLAYLAKDNDWVGFLSEAQVGGYPFELVVQVAAKEFTDPRLRTHILTVLRGMQSKKKATLSSNSDSPEGKIESSLSDQGFGITPELFQILAQCEKQKEPGKALLLKAKELSWSLLAVVASCFPDVVPLSCLTVWLEITAAREISSIREIEIASQISKSVGAAVEATNSLPAADRVLNFHYNRKTPKRRRLINHMLEDFSTATMENTSNSHAKVLAEELEELETKEDVKLVNNSDDWSTCLPQLIAVLCQQNQFFPLLRAFDMFLPSCPLLPFIRALQAFCQMRLSEASVHLGSFSNRIKEEASWISSTAVKAADAILSTCPSPYEKRCLLQLLASTDFADGGYAATYYQRLYWKINFAEPALRKHEDLQLGNETLDDASLLTALENNGYWEQARNWARQLEANGAPWKFAVHHVTERQAESMVAEWKEFLWDVPEERVALWRHCQNLFIRYSFPALQAGLFFLKHAEAVEKEIPPRELHELLLLSLQWLSGINAQSNPVCPLHLLREIETRVWLLAVESEAQMKGERVSDFPRSSQDQMSGNSASIVDQTADVVMKLDSHINAIKTRASAEKGEVKEMYNLHHKGLQTFDAGLSTATGNTKTKRRTKAYGSSRRSMVDNIDRNPDADENFTPALNLNYDLQDENLRLDASFSSWEERIGPAELERAVLSLLEFGQITAAKQLQHKLSSDHVPFELKIVDAALKLAELSTPLQKQSLSILDEDLRSLIQSYNLPTENNFFDPLQVLESLSDLLTEGSGRGICKRIYAVLKAANILGVSFLEAFEKQPIELLQLLSLKAQDSFDEARLLVHSHSIPATNIAKILAESFLKGLLAAHRGGYIDSQNEEGPAPLLWRFSDFLKWADMCPSEQEIGHALMRLVITGQDIPHACEVELLILSHHFYQSSACLDGVDVLVALAATRVEEYVTEGDFSCLARLITGVGNFHRLNFILNILIENGQLDLLLQKYSAAADANTAVADTVRGFRMAVVTALKHFNPTDHDALATVYNHFDMKHETASLLESRAEQSYQRWHLRHNKDHNEDLLESMHFYIEAAEVHSSIDAGNKTRSACAQASLVSLQIRMPDINWLNLSETSARRLLVDQTRFLEALIVAEAYNLNQPSEWTPVLWNQMLKPEIVEQFVAEFVAVLPLKNSVLIELAKFYRSEMVARGDQSNFSVWLTGGGLPAEWAKYLGRSFRCLLKKTRDLRFRLQMASVATGFNDVVSACNRTLDKVPENAGPLVLRKGHGGTYLPLM